MRRIEALFNQRNLEEIEDAVNTLSLCLVGKNENLNIKNRILRKDFISTSITPINFKKHSSSIINVMYTSDNINGIFIPWLINNGPFSKQMELLINAKTVATLTGIRYNGEKLILEWVLGR